MSGSPLDRTQLSWFDWPEVAAVRKVLDDSGFSYAYVGGALRDSLLGRRPNDVDLIADASSKALVIAFRKREMQAHVVSPSTQTVRVRFGSRSLDITSLVKPDITGDGFDDKVLAHLERYCDITINTMALLFDGRWFDPHNGQADLMAGIIRLTPGAESQLPQYAVRLVRLLRFHAIYGKQPLSEHTLRVFRTHASAVRQTEPSYFLTQFFKLISVDRLAETMALLRDTHLYSYIFPFPIREQHAVQRLRDVEKLSGLRCDPGVRLAVLLHCTPFMPNMALAAFTDSWNTHEMNHKLLQTLLDMLPLVDFSAIPPAIAAAETLGRSAAIGLLLLKWIMEPDVHSVSARYRRVLGALLKYQDRTDQAGSPAAASPGAPSSRA